MRTIDADVLKIDIVEEGQRSRRYKLGEIWELNRNEIYKVIDEQPTIEPEPHWIPCSERLPEKSGHKLCSFAKPNRIDKIYIDLAYWTGGRWYGYGSDAIIAWMPLPEPYKGE